MADQQADQAPEAAAPEAAAPEAAERTIARVAPDGEPFGFQLAELLAVARAVPWPDIDLECPPAFVEVVGAELLGAAAIVECECGTKLRVELDGEHLARCPKCRQTFRHLLVVQRDDVSPSGAALAVQAILDAQPKDGGA